MTEYSVDGTSLDRDRMMILSLRPRFADAILGGVKTVELRRTAPRIRVPTLALIYATTPVRALLGTCIVTSVESGRLAALWQAHGPSSGLDHREFLHYFEGVHAGSALSLASPRRFSRPIPLAELRSRPEGVPSPAELCLRRHRDRQATSCRWRGSQRTGPPPSPASASALVVSLPFRQAAHARVLSMCRMPDEDGCGMSGTPAAAGGCPPSEVSPCR